DQAHAHSVCTSPAYPPWNFSPTSPTACDAVTIGSGAWETWCLDGAPVYLWAQLEGVTQTMITDCANQPPWIPSTEVLYPDGANDLGGWHGGNSYVLATHPESPSSTVVLEGELPGAETVTSGYGTIW